MSEFAPPVFAGNAAGDDQAVLTPDKIEAVLADFRAWLHEFSAGASAALATEADTAAEEPLDLHTLLGQMIALRHDVNLQTRATRAQQEQNAETLAQLSQGLETLRQAKAAAQQHEEQTGDERLRPLLKTQLDLADNLRLAQREVQRAQEALLPLLDEVLKLAGPLREPPPESAMPGEIAGGEGIGSAAAQPALSFSISLWARLFGLGRVARALAAEREALAIERETLRAARQALTKEREALASLCPLLADSRQQILDREQGIQQRGQAAQRIRDSLQAIITGYQMSLQRVERSLEQNDLEPIACLDETYDPERMEVMEAVAESGRPNGEVIEEVRRGYLWRGRVFRCAQVRVARS